MRKRTIQVIVRLNAKEQQQLKKQVKKSGLSQETYIRTLIEGYAPKELPSPDFYGMMRELQTISGRMSHIAACANAAGSVEAEAYLRNVDELRVTMLAIQAAVTQPEKI